MLLSRVPLAAAALPDEQGLPAIGGFGKGGLGRFPGPDRNGEGHKLRRSGRGCIPGETQDLVFRAALAEERALTIFVAGSERAYVRITCQ